jgi:hypothetical protein
MGLMKLAEQSAHKYGRKFLYVDLNHQHLHLNDVFGKELAAYPEAIVVVKAGRELSCYLLEGNYGSKIMTISYIPRKFDWAHKPQGGFGLKLPYDSIMTRRHFENYRILEEAQSNYNEFFKKDGSLK